MSQQKDGFLTTNQSFNFNREVTGNYKASPIESGRFADWQKNNMYRSTYSQYHSKDSIEPRVSSIPKYGGYIPYVKPEGIHAKGYTPVTKECFSNQKLAKNILGLATNGFNVSKQAFIDKSKLASTSKYGKSAIQTAHPAWSGGYEGQIKSTTHDFFRNPNSQINPTYRETDKFLQTQKPQTKGTGFGTNNSQLDGRGWEKKQQIKANRTQYRDRFNEPLSFHRDTFVQNERRLGATQLNYKYGY